MRPTRVRLRTVDPEADFGTDVEVEVDGKWYRVANEWKEWVADQGIVVLSPEAPAGLFAVAYGSGAGPLGLKIPGGLRSRFLVEVAREFESVRFDPQPDVHGLYPDGPPMDVPDEPVSAG